MVGGVLVAVSAGTEGGLGRRAKWRLDVVAFILIEMI
jgi:hypothetical protein